MNISYNGSANGKQIIMVLAELDDTEQAVKAFVVREVDVFVDGIVVHQGTIVGVLKKACRSDADYRLVLKALTGKTSSKLLSPAEWHALYKFVLPVKPEGEKWHSQRGDELISMCNALVNSMVDVPEQARFA